MTNSVENIISANGKAFTEQPGILMRKLLKHWSHKMEVRFDEVSGEVKFSSGNCEFDASQENVLAMRINASNAEDVQRLEGVISSHLERLATHQTVTIEWEASSSGS